MTVLWFKAVDATLPQLRVDRLDSSRTVLHDLFVAQRRTVLSRIRAGLPAEFDEDFRPRLQTAVFDENKTTATVFGQRIVAELAGKQDGFDPDLMDAFLTVNARRAARNIADHADRDVANAVVLDGSEGAAGVFETILTAGVALWAASMVVNAANFGSHEGARASGQGRKMWQVNSQNPRDSHAAMSGETVDIDGVFSNGLRWPGYPGEASEVANCQCSLVFP
jgi:hypothetical protein